MRTEEARRLGEVLAEVPEEQLSPIVNIGSSTRQFREVSQPHIARQVFAPLAQRGVQVIHSDIKSADGVDLVGDIFDPGFRAGLNERGAKCVLCSNVLEHVPDVPAFVDALEQCVPVGGLILVTVPRSYPYHLDPIDNGFRPSPEALAGLFQRCEVVHGETVVSGTYMEELRRAPKMQTFAFLAKSAVRFPFFFYKREAWKARFHRFLWLSRNYSVSLVLFRRIR